MIFWIVREIFDEIYQLPNFTLIEWLLLSPAEKRISVYTFAEQETMFWFDNLHDESDI